MRWLNNVRLRRWARDLLRESALRRSVDAGERFREALAFARKAYLRMRGEHDPIREFVHPAWEDNIRAFESYFLDGFDTRFLNHPTISGTMVMTDRNVSAAEWEFVKDMRPAGTLRSYLGGGLNADFLMGKQMVATAMNSVNHLYHLGRFERFRGRPIEEIRTVVEFGGGYGNMARLFRNFGNLSRYVIIDLPLFCCLQFVYLSATEGAGAVHLVDSADARIREDGVTLLPLTYLKKAEPAGELFLSTWALSECPATACSHILGENWYGADELLIGFNDRWKPWETDEFVGSLGKTFRRVVTEPLPFLPGNHYIQATGKNDSPACAS